MNRYFYYEKYISYNEVLIRIYAAAVTSGDSNARSFTVPTGFWLPMRIYLGLRKPKRIIPGMELAGEIEAVGKDVKLFKEGDQVFGCSGKGRTDCRGSPVC